MFQRCTACLVEVKEDEQGQGLVEYAFILLLLSIVAIGTMAILGTTVDGLINALLSVFP